MDLYLLVCRALAGLTMHRNAPPWHDDLPELFIPLPDHLETELWRNWGYE